MKVWIVRQVEVISWGLDGYEHQVLCYGDTRLAKKEERIKKREERREKRKSICGLLFLPPNLRHVLIYRVAIPNAAKIPFSPFARSIVSASTHFSCSLPTSVVGRCFDAYMIDAHVESLLS